jgi:hypothetical protein
MASGALCDQ